jgi:hypothetical protein
MSTHSSHPSLEKQQQQQQQQQQQEQPQLIQRRWVSCVIMNCQLSSERSP